MTMKMREAVSSHCCYVYFIVCGLHCYQHSCLRFVWNIKLFFTTNIDVAKDYQNEDCIRGNETLNFITLHNFRKTRVEVTVWEANSHCVCVFFFSRQTLTWPGDNMNDSIARSYLAKDLYVGDSLSSCLAYFVSQHGQDKVSRFGQRLSYQEGPCLIPCTE